MPRINHSVNLTDTEIESLKSITHKGAGESARTIMHANILLLSNNRLGNKKKTKGLSKNKLDILVCISTNSIIPFSVKIIFFDIY